MPPLWSRLRAMPGTMRCPHPELSPQLRLPAVVLVAATASAIYTASSRRPLPISASPGGATSAYTASDSVPDISGEAARQSQGERAQAALAEPVDAAFEAARKGDVENYLWRITWRSSPTHCAQP